MRDAPLVVPNSHLRASTCPHGCDDESSEWRGREEAPGRAGLVLPSPLYCPALSSIAARSSPSLSRDVTFRAPAQWVTSRSVV